VRLWITFLFFIVVKINLFDIIIIVTVLCAVTGEEGVMLRHFRQGRLADPPLHLFALLNLAIKRDKTIHGSRKTYGGKIFSYL